MKATAVSSGMVRSPRPHSEPAPLAGEEWGRAPLHAVRSTRRVGSSKALLRGLGRRDPATLGGPDCRNPPATLTGRSTATPAPLSPCIRGSLFPIRIVGSDDVGLRVGMVEGRVDDAQREPIGDLRAEARFAGHDF